jgi:hypothetical protein
MIKYQLSRDGKIINVQNDCAGQPMEKIVFGKIRRRFDDNVNSLTPELNPSAQRCLTKFLLGILLLEPRISLIHA